MEDVDKRVGRAAGMREAVLRVPGGCSSWVVVARVGVGWPMLQPANKDGFIMRVRDTRYQKQTAINGDSTRILCTL